MRTAVGMSSAGVPGGGRRRDLGAETVDQPVEEIGAELVVVGVHARARARRAPVPARRRGARRPRRRAPLLEPGPSGVDHGDAARAGERDRRAVGGQHDQREADHGGDRGVGVGRRRRAAASTVTDVVPVHLAQPDPRRRVVRAPSSEERRDPRRFCGDRVGVVADVVTQVERSRRARRSTPPCRSVKTTRTPGASNSISAVRSTEAVSEGTRGRRTRRRRRRRRHPTSRSRCRRRDRRRRDRAT